MYNGPHRRQHLAGYLLDINLYFVLLFSCFFFLVSLLFLVLVHVLLLLLVRFFILFLVLFLVVVLFHHHLHDLLLFQNDILYHFVVFLLNSPSLQYINASIIIFMSHIYQERWPWPWLYQTFCFFIHFVFDYTFCFSCHMSTRYGGLGLGLCHGWHR